LREYCAETGRNKSIGEGDDCNRQDPSANLPWPDRRNADNGGSAGSCADGRYELLRDQRQNRQWRQSRRPRRRGQSLSDVGASSGAGAKTWHAYLSTQAADGKPAVNARDRIGSGPWQNAKGVVIAKDLAALHGANDLTKQTALSEKGEVINGRGDNPNRHDILTGSQPDGTAFAGTDDRTCKNWTSSLQGSAMLGHADRLGLSDDDAAKSWNSSHPSRGPDGGCSQNDLKSTGGDGLLYCFAIK
jgi:hypothetical protein